jgi:hypothetical protein
VGAVALKIKTRMRAITFSNATSSMTTMWSKRRIARPNRVRVRW